MHGGKLPVMVVASVVGAMAAEAAAAAMNEATALRHALINVARVDQKSKATNAESAVPSHAVNSAQINAMNRAANKEMKVWSHASHAHRVSRANPAKAVAKSARAVTAMSAATKALNSAL